MLSNKFERGCVVSSEHQGKRSQCHRRQPSHPSGNWIRGSRQVKPQFPAIGEKLGDLFPAHGSPAYVYDIDAADRDAWEEYLEGATDEVFGYGYIDAAGRWVINPTYGDTLIRAPRR